MNKSEHADKKLKLKGSEITKKQAPAILKLHHCSSLLRQIFMRAIELTYTHKKAKTMCPDLENPTNNDRETELQAEIEDLKQRHEARKIIDRAKGILIDQGMSEQEAFSSLQKTSMDTRRPLREIAEAVIINAQILDR